MIIIYVLDGKQKLKFWRKKYCFLAGSLLTVVKMQGTTNNVTRLMFEGVYKFVCRYQRWKRSYFIIYHSKITLLKMLFLVNIRNVYLYAYRRYQVFRYYCVFFSFLLIFRASDMALGNNNMSELKRPLQFVTCIFYLSVEPCFVFENTINVRLVIDAKWPLKMRWCD